MKLIQFSVPAALLAASILATGCGGGASTDTGAASSSTTAAATASGPKLNLDVPAGITITAPTDASNKQLIALAQQHGFSASGNPFALTASEKSFDTSQIAVNLVSNNGHMGFMGPDSEPAPVVPVLEEQPYRRLSGISIGNAVYAILQIGTDNSNAQIIYPGAQVKGTDWTVVSINGDYAVLSRPGDKLPHEIQVRLEQPPLGSQPSNSGGGSGPAGGGQPGGPGRGPRMGGTQGGGGGSSAAG